MKVIFCQHENDFVAHRAAIWAVESYFLQKIYCDGHPTKILRGAIDGVPISKNAGFPFANGWKTAARELMIGFVCYRQSWMKNVLKLTIEYNGYQPLNMAGSFFLRVQDDKEKFLEVNFQEEFDRSCADPMDILGQFMGEKDFTLERILMAGQHKLTIEESQFDDSNCLYMARCLTRALKKQQSHYRWKTGKTPSGRELRPELPLRSARLNLSIVEEKNAIPYGILGPKLKNLAEQFLV